MLIEYTPAKDNDVTAARGHDGFIASYTAADQFTGTPPRGATRLDNTHARTLLAHPRSAGEEGLCFAVFYFFSYIFSDCCQTNYLNIYTKFAGLVELWPLMNDLKLCPDPLWDVAVATNFVDKIDLQYTPCSSHDIH